MFISKKRFVIFSLMLAVLWACKKEQPTTVDDQPSFTAIIDGVSWVADSCTAEINDTSNFISIGGKTSDVTVVMGLYGVSKGSFDLNTYPNTLSIVQNNTTYTTLPGTGATPGSVTITINDKVNHTLSGEFSSTLIDPVSFDTIEVTGKFNKCPYTEITGGGGGGTGGGGGSGGGGSINCSNDEMQATVDGSLFTGLVAPAPISLGNDNWLQITLTSVPPSKSIVLSFIDTIQVGTHPFSSPTAAHNLIYTEAFTHSYSAISGNLTIEAIDTGAKKVKGSFEAVVKDSTGVSKNITNGSFCVSY